MSFLSWYDFAGMVGVALVLSSYLFLQLRRLRADDRRYSAMNALGAALILLSLAFDFNLSAFVVEFAWLAISLIGLVRNPRVRAADV